MKAIKVGGGLDKLELVDIADPGQPGPGEIRVKLHASSLNYHDYGVVSRGMEAHMGRIPMSDGAGVVEALLPFALLWVSLPLAAGMLAVLAYRFFNLWLPLVPAAIGLRSMRAAVVSSSGNGDL